MLRSLSVLLLLACCACERTPQAWFAELDSADSFDRFLAAVALIQEDGKVPGRVFTELVRITQDPDPAMCATAVRVLADFPDEATRAYLMLLDAGGPRAREP